MASERSNTVLWVVAAVVVVLLLPVFAIVFGFTLTPLMAITAWSRNAWVTIAAAIILIAVVAAVLRRKTPAP
jgi:hypothetical protein